MSTETHTAAPPGIAAGTEVKAYPPRYWWLKRLVVAGAVWLLAMVGLRIVWGILAEQRLQETLAAYRAAGQPVTLDDFRPAPIRDEQNAAVALREAAKLLAPANLSGTHQLLRHNRAYLDSTATTFFEQQSAALRWIRIARGRAQADWQFNPNPVFNPLGPMPDFSQQRQVARVIGAATIYWHVLGDDFEAAESLRDMWMVGQRIGQRGPSAIALLVQYAIDGLSLVYLEELLPVISVDRPPLSQMPVSRCATRAQLIALRDELLNEAAVREHWRRSMWYERASSLQLAQSIRDGSYLAAGGTPSNLTNLAGAVGNAIAGPLIDSCCRQVCSQHSRLGEAGLVAPYLQAREHASFDAPARASMASLATRMLSDMLIASLESVLDVMFRALVERRLAATAIAVRLYALDHGQRPATLEALVPDYLPAVPLDPFDPDGGPLRYLPAAASPLVYSVGIDAEDDHGDLTARPGSSWRDSDIGFYLNGDRPHRISSATTAATGTGPASAPAGEGEPDPGAAEGQPDASAPPGGAAGATGGPAGATDSDSESGAHDDRIRQDPASGGK